MVSPVADLPADDLAWNEAIAILQRAAVREDQDLTIFARRCLANAAEHLATRLAKTFRSTPRLDSADAARTLLHSAGQELQHASRALLTAAERFKGLGKGLWANDTYLAHKRAHQALEDLAHGA